MDDDTRVSEAAEYDAELVGDRHEIAAVLSGVVDGLLAGAIRLGDGAEAVRVDVADEIDLEIELEAENDALSLELELEWPAQDAGSTAASTEIESVETGGDSPPTAAAPTDASASMARFEVFADRGGEWRWRLRHRNGNVIATSGEGYTQKHNARKGLRSVMENSPAAEVREEFTN